MNIKKTLSKVLACSLVLASTLAVSPSSTRANAAEVKSKWNTLVLICPEVDIQKGPYTAAATTNMKDSEIKVIQDGANYLGTKITSNIDVKVSEMPITNIELSQASGRSVILDDILDKYAPKGYYDSILVVYRNKDGATNLGTHDITLLPKDGHTNGAILSTIKLDNEDHNMKYYSFDNPLFLVDNFAASIYQYFTSEGFDLHHPQYVDPKNPINDPNIFFKNQSRYYGYFFNGVPSMGWDGKSGVTTEMWQHRPSNSK